MGSLEKLELPDLIPENHRWERSKANPRLWQRRGIGAESIVGHKTMNPTGQYDLYPITTMRVSDPAPASTRLSLAYLKEKFELALLIARFEHPVCGYTAKWDERVAPIIEYESPDGEGAIKTARDSVHTRATSKTGHEVWYEVEEERQNATPNAAKSLELYLVADVSTENSQLLRGATVDIVAHFNHLFWDGIGARMICGVLLRSLNYLLGIPARQAPPELPWGEEVSRLSPNPLDSMKFEVGDLSCEYDSRRKEYLNTLMIKGGAGIPFKPGDGRRVPRAVVVWFTEAESKAMVKAVKIKLGPEYTLTHLTQAAVVLAMLDMYKPTELAKEVGFIAAMPVNGRRYIREELQDNHMSICVAGAIVTIPNIKPLIVSLESDDNETVVKALVNACKDSKSSFDRWVTSPVQMPVSYSYFTFEGNFLAQNPYPFDKVAAPFLASDGINDRFVPKNVASIETGETFLTTERYVFLLNQFLPFLALRLESWRGASSLNICYNEDNHNCENVLSYLRLVSKYMLAFAM